MGEFRTHRVIFLKPSKLVQNTCYVNTKVYAFSVEEIRHHQLANYQNGSQHRLSPSITIALEIWMKTNRLSQWKLELVCLMIVLASGEKLALTYQLMSATTRENNKFADPAAETQRIWAWSMVIQSNN